MKCNLKKLYLLLVPFICLLGSLTPLKNASAAEKIGTSGLRFLVQLYGASSYGWSNTLLFNTALSGAKYARSWEFTTSNFTSTGTNAVLNFTTEITFEDNAPYAQPWVNTDYMDVLYCDFNGTRLEKIGSNVTYAGSELSYPSPGSNITRSTSKWIGNIGLGGLPKNTSGQLKCVAGSYNYAFFSADSVTGIVDGNIRFKSNDTYITMTDDSANQLLQEQLVQTQQLIDIERQIAEQIRQNQIKIDELNQQIVQTQQNIQAIEAELTNPNVNGTFNTPPIQPFGPIGTITNSILELPRIILNVNSCSPLTPELPYIHENIEIPCPSTILNGMAGGFMTFLDTIASAGIWFILARYIFKKVQKLRDPENTDEEYLDI